MNSRLESILYIYIVLYQLTYCAGRAAAVVVSAKKAAAAAATAMGCR